LAENYEKNHRDGDSRLTTGLLQARSRAVAAAVQARR